MLRLEAAVKILRIISEHRRPMYTYDETIEALNYIGLNYTVEEDGEDKHVTFEVEPKIKAHFTQSSKYKLLKYNIVHTLLNEITEYVNELEVKDIVSKHDLEICKADIKLLETVGFDKWEQKEIAIQKILELFNEDEIVATFMYLKFISKCSGDFISYIERHNDYHEYYGNETDMYIEIYDNSFEKVLSLDIVNCKVMSNKVDLIINPFMNLDIESLFD